MTTPNEPKRRLRTCVENWPEAETGEYNPGCCRFPKSCAATVYDEACMSEEDLEPAPAVPDPRTTQLASGGRLNPQHASEFARRMAAMGCVVRTPGHVTDGAPALHPGVEGVLRANADLRAQLEQVRAIVEGRTGGPISEVVQRVRDAVSTPPPAEGGVLPRGATWTGTPEGDELARLGILPDTAHFQLAMLLMQHHPSDETFRQHGHLRCSCGQHLATTADWWHVFSAHLADVVNQALT